MNPFLTVLASLRDERARRWTPMAAGMAAILMAWNAAEMLFERFAQARYVLGMDFPRSALGGTYNGLLKALVRQAASVLPVLQEDLRRQTRPLLAKLPRTGGWILLAVDGSKEELPRTKDHEDTFGMADNGAFPQALLTAIVEVHTGLLWDWRIDRGDGSEKGHLQDMVAMLPAGERTLLLADGYFVGHGLWQALQAAGQAFLLRVGGNVYLLEGLFPAAIIERRGDIVYAWPKDKQHRVPPLRLRLIRLGAPGPSIWLLTNVLDPRRLSRRMAGQIYRLRWGVELFYRTFKRTLNLAKLKSRSGLRGRVELEWALIACWVLTLMGVTTLRRAREDPRRLSPAGLAHAVHGVLGPVPEGGVRPWRQRFFQALRNARRDDYQRHRPKRSRHRPKTTQTPVLRLQPPHVRHATLHERRRAATFADRIAA
jgi:hypothetical protein